MSQPRTAGHGCNSGRRLISLGAALPWLALACARTGFVGPPDPCQGVACGGHGTCAALADGAPTCTCAPGYTLLDPLTCAPSTTALDAGGSTLDGARDAAPVDTGGDLDAAAADCGGPADQGSVDGATEDRVLEDSAQADAVVGDSATEDASSVDTGGEDAAGQVPWAPALATWQYRKLLRIPARAPAAQLVEFPLLIARSDVDLRDHALPSGLDLRFADQAGNLLVHQRERYDGASGALIAWVLLPAYDSAVDTLLYLYYGGDPGSPETSSSAVWSNGYLGVWHLNEAADGTAGEYVDSSGQGHHASAGGTTPPLLPTQVVGQIGDGQSLDGNNDLITTGASLLNGASSLTLSLWSLVRTAGGGLAGQNDVLELGFYWPDRLNAWTSGITTVCPGKTISSLCTPDFALDTWFLVAVTWDGSEAALYVDGVEKHRVPMTTLVSSGDPFNIGGEVFEPSGGLLDGVVDELRLSTVARSPAWLALEHANQLAPEAFVLFGAQETRP